MCKICGLPEEACLCDECFIKEKVNSSSIIVESTNNGKTILRRIKNPDKVLDKLRQMFNCCGKTTKNEVILHGQFVDNIRALIHSSPSLFLFSSIIYIH
jgi:translation initiation factor 1 (eIF-1/SUI1)